MPRILAVGVLNNETVILDTSTGELHPWDKLASLVVQGDGGYLAGTNLFRYVGALNQIFEDYPNWRLQVRARKRTLIRGDRRSVIGSFLPIQFGFTRERKRGADKSSRAKARIFDCIDLEDICNVRTVSLQDSLTLAQSILDLCDERGIKFTAGRGGLAARLLKASPQWELGRRAAPEFVNNFARERLPGNYYGLGAKLRKTYRSAVYVDQVSAHHAVAATTKIPHPATIRARGNHRALESGVLRSWTRETGDVGGIGLLACSVSVGNIPDSRKHLFPPFMHTPGRQLAYIYTNELEYFDGIHGTIEYVCAAWTAPTACQAIPEFAQWALERRSVAPGRKPVLLAAYGSLALRTDRPSVSYYSQHSRGKRTFLPGAGVTKEVIRHRKPNQPQPSIVNVLARGMIEAETRRRSIMLAREMDAMGIPVLSIYVDGLILETAQIPILPEGWSVEAELTNLSFHHAAGFTSDQVSKLPGIPRGGSAGSMMRAARVSAEDPSALVWSERAKARDARVDGTWKRDEKASLRVAKAIVRAKIHEAREEAKRDRKPAQGQLI